MKSLIRHKKYVAMILWFAVFLIFATGAWAFATDRPLIYLACMVAEVIAIVAASENTLELS